MTSARVREFAEILAMVLASVWVLKCGLRACGMCADARMIASAVVRAGVVARAREEAQVSEKLMASEV